MGNISPDLKNELKVLEAKLKEIDSLVLVEANGGKLKMPPNPALNRREDGPTYEKPKELGVIITEHGTSGQKVGDKIALALEKYNEDKTEDKKLGLSWDERKRKLTVTNSSHLKAEDLKLLLESTGDNVWKPMLCEVSYKDVRIPETSADGNFQIILVARQTQSVIAPISFDEDGNMSRARIEWSNPRQHVLTPPPYEEYRRPKEGKK